jgi:2-oxoglutarate ferredoxin oxidoreductase subunit beta
MSFINKPKVRHPDLPKNAIGLTRRDYEGAMSTLCAGCGHDSVTSAIIQAIWELGIRPEQIAKLSGIGCSSKTTAYFASGAHGFNAVHGRMPSIATGASAANRDLHYIGISGDGDSLSIGFGQFAHSIRRNVNMLYICENNGVYGLTKGQFSASADIGTKSKKGDENLQAPVDPCLAALSLGGTFIARSFSGDKDQLVPLIKAGLRHRGFAMIDVISPCVTFNDHVGSTKSYEFTREHYQEAVHADYIPARQEITAQYAEGEVLPVQMHDGSHLLLRKLDRDYDPTHRGKAFEYLRTRLRQGEHVTGLIFVQGQGTKDMHEMLETTEVPLNQVPYEKMHPGAAGLATVMKRYG